MSTTSSKADEPKQVQPTVAKEPYFLPDLGVSVEATSVEDAVAQAKQSKQVTVKDGDGNL